MYLRETEADDRLIIFVHLRNIDADPSASVKPLNDVPVGDTIKIAGGGYVDTIDVLGLRRRQLRREDDADHRDDPDGRRRGGEAVGGGPARREAGARPQLGRGQRLAPAAPAASAPRWPRRSPQRRRQRQRQRLAADHTYDNCVTLPMCSFALLAQ